jgi:hypothetical protein
VLVAASYPRPVINVSPAQEILVPGPTAGGISAADRNVQNPQARAAAFEETLFLVSQQGISTHGDSVEDNEDRPRLNERCKVFGDDPSSSLKGIWEAK